LWQKIPNWENGGRFYCENTAAPMDKIKAKINSGYPVLLNVDLVGNDNKPDHWVLGVEVQGDNIVVNDPWYGDRQLITKRYGKSASVAILGGSYFNIKYESEEFMTLPLVRLPDGRVFMVAWDNAMSHIPNPDELNKYWKVQNIREIKNPEEIGGWIVENPNPIKTALAAAQRQIEGIKGELATCKGDFNECTNTMSKMLTPQECDVELAKANQSRQEELVKVYEGHTREIDKLNDTVDNLNDQIRKLKEAASGRVDKWWQRAIGWLVNVIFKRWFK